MLGALAVDEVNAWLTFAVVVVVAWLVYRGGGSGALSTLRTANDVLERKVKDDAARIRTLEARVLELQSRTDVAEAVTPVQRAIERHEERAQERGERLLTILNLIAERLGPNGADA